MDASSVSRDPRRVRTFFKYFSRSHPTGSKKNELKPWLKQQWCLPPKASAAFVAAMEDVLDLYHRPQAPTTPVVCVDERVSNTSKRSVTLYGLFKHRVAMTLNTNAMASAICL